MSETPAAGPVQTPWIRRFYFALMLLGAFWTGALVLFGTLAATNRSAERFVSQSVFTVLAVLTVSAGLGYCAARLRQGQHDLRARSESVRDEIAGLRDHLDERDGKLYQQHERWYNRLNELTQVDEARLKLEREQGRVDGYTEGYQAGLAARPAAANGNVVALPSAADRDQQQRSTHRP